MSKVVTAIYEQGVLRPLDPLNLREHQAVYIQILTDAVEKDAVEKDPAEEAIRILVTSGLMLPPERGMVPPDPISEEKRQALAERLGQAPGKPLSELILEDRGNW